MTGVVTFGLPTMNSLVFAQGEPHPACLVAVVGPAARSCRHRARRSPGRPRRSVRAVAANAQIRSTSASRPTRQAACRPSPCRSSSCGTRKPVMGEKPVPRPVGTRLSSLILCPTEGKCCRRPRASLLSMTALVVARAASWAGPWRYRRAGDAYATANPLTKVHPDRTRPAFGSGARFRASVGRRRPPDLNFR